jgi:hypothetical protein
MLLRPDGVLLYIALAAGLFWYIPKARMAPPTPRLTRSLSPAYGRVLVATSIYCLAALLPIAAWAMRNWVRFHVFQPLAPRYLNDPGERYNAGFYRWLRSWSVEYVTTANVFWNVGTANIEIADLPARAFDSLEQRGQTFRLIAEYNLNHSMSVELDDAFAALAAERIRTHPFRYYLEVPLLRVTDMVLRPRTWAFDLDCFWWRWAEHPGQTSWAILLGLINLMYVGAAAWAFLRRRVPWAWMLGGYLLLRCLLLGTMENSEPRYTLECFPIFIVAAAAMLAERRARAARAESVPAMTVGAGLLCENPKQTVLRMRPYHYCLLWVGLALTTSVAWSKPVPQTVAGSTASVPLVLTGGTVIDVADWGHSARDLPDAVVIIRDGRITDVGAASAITVPKGARVIDCTGKFIIPGLVDGYTGMNSQGQANANLYMGVTTLVVRNDHEHGLVDYTANPRPHLYAIDPVGTTDNWSLLAKQSEWLGKLREGLHPVELSPEDTSRQLNETAKLGTRVVFLGHNITAANTQWIVFRAHQLGMISYGEFISTPYRVGVEAGVDALVHMNRYDLGVIPDELQAPLVDDPQGPSANTASDYSERIPPTDVHLRTYAHFLAAHHTALMPTFSLYFLNLPGHWNLWKEPVAAILNSAQMFNPSNVETGELDYTLPYWTRHLPAAGQRWMEEGQRKKADQEAMRMWLINQTIFAAYPHYLAASGAPVQGSMPGISLHTELNLLVRLGLSPREALAAATNNYAIQFGWNELGMVAPGRRADILVVDSDPTVNIWNVRRISTLILDGNVVDRDDLLKLKR